jgi:hypothetical protein
LIGLSAYHVGRNNGAGRARSAAFALGSLFVASAIAVVKNYLLGH